MTQRRQAFGGSAAPLCPEIISAENHVARMNKIYRMGKQTDIKCKCTPFGDSFSVGEPSC
jgi:hypothetical protein